MYHASRSTSIELSIPSELGYERVAREAVAAFARRLGFDGEQIEDLKTAISEACINAIEHGNAKLPGLRVDVSCFCDGKRLTVEVLDQGMKTYDGHRSSCIESKLCGAVSRRGMGLQIIGQLVDEYSIEAAPGGGNMLRLCLGVRARA